jgi:ATP-dependent DNA helicase RecQ
MSIFTNRPGESGIIYCQSRKTVDSVAERLQSRGIQALPYHAGLSDDDRKQNQERFIREDIEVIVATIAFDMGINKPNVRYIIHYDLPKTLEHYYQETGRAGRDGLQSECLLLYSYGDKFFYDRFIADKQTEEERRIAKAQLQRMIDYAQSKICRRALLLQYFAEPFTKQKM